MHSYAIFTAKRGRPKSNPVPLSSASGASLDVVTSLFHLKKLTADEVSAAHYYEKLCRNYYASIEAPVGSSGCIIDLAACRSWRHPKQNDSELARRWGELRAELNKIDSESLNSIEEYKIEFRDKNELIENLLHLIGK